MVYYNVVFCEKARLANIWEVVKRASFPAMTLQHSIPLQGCRRRSRRSWSSRGRATGTVNLVDSATISDKDVVIQVWEDDDDRCDGNSNLKPQADTTSWDSGNLWGHFLLAGGR